jgi:hypothetical protein
MLSQCYLISTNLVRAMREVHSNNIEASWEVVSFCAQPWFWYGLPFRSIVIFSAEFVLGPVFYIRMFIISYTLFFGTNRANDCSPTMNLLGLVFCVEVALPFQLSAVVEVSQCVCHLDD